MTQTSLKDDVAVVCEQVEAIMRDGTRTIVGVAGPPASGKSTLAESVVQSFNQGEAGPVPKATLLPMDGYHLDNRLLESRGLLARKGAPETFNAIGFCEAVQQLKSATHETFHPKFDRQMDLSIANSISIHPKTPLIVVEGNYLFLKSEPWCELHDLFDLTIFVCPSMDDLRKRLEARWLKHGLDADAAKARATGNDLPNAKLVIAESREADLHLSQNYKEFGIRYAY